MMNHVSNSANRHADLSDETTNGGQSVLHVDLASFDNTWYQPGSAFKKLAWYVVNQLFFKTGLPIPSNMKCAMLRAFGARIGRQVVIKPSVNIKYAWLLTVGDNVWLGENVWIDNLAQVEIADNVCISQAAYILTGNHDYTSVKFDLMIKPVRLERGVWVGARAVIGPGVVMRSHSIASVGSVIVKDTEAGMIYQGNPATAIRRRNIKR